MRQEAGVMERESARGKYWRQHERRPMTGMRVHLDASTQEWSAGLPMQDLVVALDNTDGRMLYARFFPQEGIASTVAFKGLILQLPATHQQRHFVYQGSK
jgi:hypothetical protein